MGQRSRHVRGPMSPVMIYLMQAGWAADSATAWQVPNDRTGGAHTWHFRDEAFVGLDQAQPLLDEFEATLSAQLWSQAAQQYCGARLEYGADLQSYR
eukprot:935737-Pyramimonas_sp.AAC.1